MKKIICFALILFAGCSQSDDTFTATTVRLRVNNEWKEFKLVPPVELSSTRGFGSIKGFCLSKDQNEASLAFDQESCQAGWTFYERRLSWERLP